MIDIVSQDFSTTIPFILLRFVLILKKGFLSFVFIFNFLQYETFVSFISASCVWQVLESRGLGIKEI